MRARAQEWPDRVEGRVRSLAAVPYFAGLEAADLRALARRVRRFPALAQEHCQSTHHHHPSSAASCHLLHHCPLLDPIIAAPP